MVYVARFTLDPIADIERGWSGYMGVTYSSLLDAAQELLGDKLGYDALEDKTDSELSDLLDRYEFDVRMDDKLGALRPVHHDGLSCFRLSAETLEDALTEEHADAIGEGFRTIGNIRYVCPVPGDDGWHIFECVNTAMEQ